MNLLTYLPNYLKDSLSCYTLVNSKVIDRGPDIAICDTNGFLHEVKNKKILLSLNLSSKGISVCCSYLWQKEKLMLYYTILTESHKLLIIRRTVACLQVVEGYENVQKFEVYDFESVGFPQVRISFLNADNDLMWQFPIQKLGRVKTEFCKITTKEHMGSSLLTESLEEKLQILKKHVDELNEEYNLLRKQFSPKELPIDVGMVSVGRVKFSLPLEKHTQPVLKVCDKWVKVFGTSLVLGMKICNCSCESISDVELRLGRGEIREYRYRIFEGRRDPREDLFSPGGGEGVLEAAGEAWVVGAFRVPPFLSGSPLSVCWRLTSAGVKTWLLRESFEVSVLDVASRGSVALEEPFLGEDLMAMRTSKEESHLEIRTEDANKGAMEAMMAKALGFGKLKDEREEMFYCTSAYLRDVLVGLREMAKKPSVWRMVLLTSEEAQIYFVVNALYELLGERTVICSVAK